MTARPISSHSPVPASTMKQALAGVVAVAAMTLSGCSFATLTSYTPAVGVQTDQSGLKIRNLLIVANDAGKGVVSGSVLSADGDQLTGISGVALKPDNTNGGTLKASPVNLMIPAGDLINLTKSSFNVSSPSLKPGLLASLTLTFSKAGAVTLQVPVVDSTDPDFTSVPVPSASASTNA